MGHYLYAQYNDKFLQKKYYKEPNQWLGVEIRKWSIIVGVELVKASLDLTGKYPNTNKGIIGFLDVCN